MPGTQMEKSPSALPLNFSRCRLGWRRASNTSTYFVHF